MKNVPGVPVSNFLTLLYEILRETYGKGSWISFSEFLLTNLMNNKEILSGTIDITTQNHRRTEQKI